MKKLFFFYLCLIAAIFAGLHIQKDPGYVLLALGKWTVEMSLWLFIFVLLGAAGLIHYTLNTLHLVGTIKYRFSQMLKRWRSTSSQNKTREGLIDFSEGNWASAEKKLIKGLPSSDSPLINYLTAAKAAQEMNQLHRRDKYLREAENSMPETKIAVLLTQAELQLMSKQYEQANATLKHLNSMVPKHPHVLKLMLSLYKDIKDWQELSKLLPKLTRYKIISYEELLTLEKNILMNQIPTINTENDNKALLSLWTKVSKKLKLDPELVSFYITHLNKHNEHQQAETILRTTIKKHWHESLIELYGQLDNIDINKQLKFTESLLRSQPNSAALYQALGILSKKLQLWGKSKTYLERSAELNPTQKTYFELGELYRQLNDESSACNGFKKGLELAMK